MIRGYRDIDLERFIEALRIARRSQPEQRIGQLIMNALPSGNRDLFYVTNDRLCLALTGYAGNKVGICQYGDCREPARKEGRMCSEHFSATVRHGPF